MELVEKELTEKLICASHKCATQLFHKLENGVSRQKEKNDQIQYKKKTRIFTSPLYINKQHLQTTLSNDSNPKLFQRNVQSINAFAFRRMLCNIFIVATRCKFVLLQPSSSEEGTVERRQRQSKKKKKKEEMQKNEASKSKSMLQMLSNNRDPVFRLTKTRLHSQLQHIRLPNIRRLPASTWISKWCCYFLFVWVSRKIERRRNDYLLAESLSNVSARATVQFNNSRCTILVSIAFIACVCDWKSSHRWTSLEIFIASKVKHS